MIANRLFNRLLTTSFLLLACTYMAEAQVYGEPVVQWDFADGINDEWINESATGIAHWEFRGPDTEPDNSVCSQGSCGLGSVPIASESLDNGFVIFDSNYWDDDLGPCGAGIGSGQDPAPHEAWLISPSINLEGIESAVLTFQQQFKHYTTPEFEIYTSVQVSIDGGETFETVLENPGDYEVSSAGEWATTNISELAAGQPDVRFRFLFSGFYYWWCIDDITVYVPNENDLLISDPRYTLFDYNQDPDGYGEMEYNGYPQNLVREFNFSSGATNVGGETQSTVRVKVNVLNELSEIIYADTSWPIIMQPAQFSVLTVDDPWLPSSELGHYTINWDIYQMQEEDTPDNNIATEDYYVTEHSLIRDEGVMESQYISAPQFDSLRVEVGNLFEVWDTTMMIHSISVAIGDSTDIGTPIYGVVYVLGQDSVFGYTESYEVNSYDINSIGDSYFVHLPLLEPILANDTLIYLAMVGDSTDIGDAFIARSGVPPIQSSLVSYPDNNGLYYMLETAMVRINVFPIQSNPGCMDPLAGNYNPEADVDDGGCLYPGCTDPEADNYDANVNYEDGSCMYLGCTDPEADNYDPTATDDDGSCMYLGCTDPDANNYDPDANSDDGSCVYNDAFMSVSEDSGCLPFTITVFNQTEVVPEGACVFELDGSVINETCDQSFEYTFTETGTYTISYSYTVNDFTSEFEYGPITVYDPVLVPEISFDEENLILSCDCPEAESIDWFLNDELYASDSETLDVIENGAYYVVITNANDCDAQSNEIEVVSISVEEFDGFAGDELLIYPNPAGNWVIISQAHVGDQIDVIDQTGRLAFSAVCNSRNQLLDLSRLSPGAYIVRVISGDQASQERLIISR